ncbi:MAG TPA: galactokinase [Polyangia bacterium]|nr:galactokinase [Polyangia bacterium]
MSESSSPSFAELFGAPPSLSAWAPGRVNLIGEHTDYQGGFVMPLALHRGTRVQMRARDDDRVRVYSAADPEAGVRSYRLGGEERAHDWADYVRGVTAEARAAGYAIRGFDALVTSDLPMGGGLSSSAALEVSVLRALRRAFDLALDDKTLARLARRAETELVGVPVGVMDQMASSLGDPTHALFLDTRSLAWERIELPPEVNVLIVDPRIPHRNADSAYRLRRRESEQAALELGVPQLRDLTVEDLPGISALPEPLNRRARHVVTENARVLAFRSALLHGAIDTLGALLMQSHHSLRDDFQVSLPEIDDLVDVCATTDGVLGARLTGGGFGGSIVVLAAASEAPAVASRVATAYAARTGRTATTILTDHDLHD